MFRKYAIRLALSATVAQHANTIKFTDRVWDRIVAVNAKEQAPDSRPLRLEIGSGGCHGFTYCFKFDAEPIDPEMDIVFEKDDVNPPPTITSEGELEPAPSDAPKRTSKVVVDKETLTKLQGATVDYHTELKGASFCVIGNELVDAACSCGQSISLKQPKR